MTNANANLLIAALPELAYSQWAPQLKLVEMRLGDVLHEPGRHVDHVYFPTTGIVSLLQTLKNGASTEIAVVGNEGFVGVPALMGGKSAPTQSVVRSAGHGYRLPAGEIAKALESVGPVARLLLLYTQALMTQISQAAVCTRHHRLHQRLCRLLLASLDRLDTHEIWMTQALICNMLGVRREGVTEAAISLQRDGLIRYRRAHIRRRPSGARTTQLRVLCGDQERIRPIASGAADSDPMNFDCARSIDRQCSVSHRQAPRMASSYFMTSQLTDDQLKALRFARGDCIPQSPKVCQQTKRQDQNLLIAMMLIERRDGLFQITACGCDYLERVDAENLAEQAGEDEI